MEPLAEHLQDGGVAEPLELRLLGHVPWNARQVWTAGIVGGDRVARQGGAVGRGPEALPCLLAHLVRLGQRARALEGSQGLARVRARTTVDLSRGEGGALEG